jgi:aminoglycoside phosphotransferase (APT) family kinase protein
VGIGEPGEDYPYRWAVHRWIPGEGAELDRVDDPVEFALSLAEVVRKLQAVPTDGAPSAYNRARPLHEYDELTRCAIDSASRLIDSVAARAVWEEALAASPHDALRCGFREIWRELPRARRPAVRNRRLGGRHAPVTPP